MKRYTEIYTLKKPAYANGAPAIIGKVSVFYDSLEKRRVILCKIRSISGKAIKNATVDQRIDLLIKLCPKFEHLLHNIDHFDVLRP
jgi:hypothetical protein